MADNKNSIDEIVSGVNEALKSGSVSSDNVRLEFFEEDGVTPALVFEEEEIMEAPSEPTASQTESECAETKEEAKPSSKAASDEPKIWTTYVPKFTDASQTYRMKGQPAPKNEAEQKTETVSAENTETVDPTGELIESAVTDATLVRSSVGGLNEGEDVSTMFKFSQDVDLASDDKAEPEDDTDTLEDPELAEEPILSEEAESAVEENLFADAKSETETEEQSGEAEPYSMPDPAVPEESSLPVPCAPVAVESVDERPTEKKRSLGEYNSFSDTDEFFDKFLDSIMSVRVRLIASLIVALGLLLIENLSLFGIDLIKIMNFDGVSGAMAIIDAPFVAALFLLALPEVIASFSALGRKKLIPEISITVSFAVVMIYYLLVVIFSDSDGYALFGFLYSIFTISSIFAAYQKKKADFTAFKLISKSGEKKVVDRKLTRNLPAEHRALDGKIESYKSRTARVFRTSFVSDFKERISLISENPLNATVILGVSLFVSLVSALVAFFIPGGIFAASKTFATVFMFSVPAVIFLTHKIPFYSATLEAKEENCALIGEKSFYDYAAVDVVAFDDTEIFTKEDVNLQRIMVYGRKENLPKAMQQMSALFCVVGGPLAQIFAKALDRRVNPAENVAVDVDGVIGYIDGVEIMAGSAEFIARQGLKIPEESSGESGVLSTTRIMYAAEAGEIYAKFYIRYMLSEDFTMILPSLTDESIRPLVYTRDPNINEELFRSLTAGSDTISVLKKQNLPADEKRLYQKISLGMVSVGDKINVINSLLVAKKYALFQSKMALTELFAMMVGALLSLVIVICSLTELPSAILGVWHIAWCLAIFIIAKRSFGVQKTDSTDGENKENNENNET